MKREHKKNALILVWLCIIGTGLFFLTGCGFGCGNNCLGFTIFCGEELPDESNVSYLDVSLFGQTSDFFLINEDNSKILGCDTSAGSSCNNYAGYMESKEVKTEVCYYGCGSCTCARGKMLGQSTPCVVDGEIFKNIGVLTKEMLDEKE